MQKNRQLGGPNNPANKRKLIQSQVDVRQMIVIDNGTQTVKIGRSGVDYPSVIIDTVAGYARTISENDANPPKRVYFGKQLIKTIEQKRYLVEQSYPIESSYIPQNSLDDMIDLWEYALVDVMGVQKSGANILMIDSTINSKEYKAKLTEALFEKLKVHSVLFMNSSVLSLFSVGQTTGLVTEIGHGTTTVVPVFQGFVLNHALQHSKIAGKQITQILEEQLQKQKIKFQFKDKLNYASIVKGIKEKNVKIAESYENQIENDDRTEEQKFYQLPDGTVIQLSKQTVYRPAEVIFSPSMFGIQAQPLHTMIQNSLNHCQYLKDELCKNVVFCGGSSMIQGLKQRIHHQIDSNSFELNEVFDWQRRYSSWIGGSMIGSLSTFQQLAITNTNTEHLTVNQIIRRIL